MDIKRLMDLSRQLSEVALRYGVHYREDINEDFTHAIKDILDFAEVKFSSIQVSEDKAIYGIMQTNDGDLPEYFHINRFIITIIGDNPSLDKKASEWMTRLYLTSSYQLNILNLPISESEIVTASSIVAYMYKLPVLS